MHPHVVKKGTPAFQSASQDDDVGNAGKLFWKCRGKKKAN